jgi:hypothetical protein
MEGKMKRFIKIGTVLMAATLIFAPAAMATGDGGGGNPHPMVTICHVTPGNSVTLTLPEDQANGHLTGKSAGHDENGPVKDYLGECKEDPKPPVVSPVAPEVVASTQCEVNGSVTPATTANVVYVVGGTSPTAITVTATPAQGFKFSGESQQVVYGPYDVSASKCPSSPPTEPPAPPAGPPAPPKDFCPDLEGVQWENYDCNTGQVVPVAPVETPTATPVPTETPVVDVPVVEVPDKPVIPSEQIDAGEQPEGNPWLLGILYGMIIGGVAACGIAAVRLWNK